MHEATTITETRQFVARLRRAGQSIGFVPTMGALHDGHRSLIKAAASRCHGVVVSIFVNPTQFGRGEKLDRYPRTIEADLELCDDAGVDLVFAPPVAEMYTADAQTHVTVSRLTKGLCGDRRIGHFDGVTTVVAKLFNIVVPDMAFFGEKDYQQLKVIQQMVRDLNMPIEIVPCPTVRDPDGLATSSRNVQLSPEGRVRALSLHQALESAAVAITKGTVNVSALIDLIERHILAAGPAEIDYVRVVRPDTLERLDVVDGPARICLAVKIDGCRLIDNLAVDGSPATR